MRAFAFCLGAWLFACIALVALGAEKGFETACPIRFDFRRKDRFYKPWEACVGSGHAKLALRKDWQMSLVEARNAIGFERVRFHGLFDDDMGVVNAAVTRPEVRGSRTPFKYELDFTKIQTIFDFLIRDANVMPYIELSFMPGAFASGKTTYLHYKARTDPPKNYTEWGDLMYSFGTFLVDRYGIENASKLYFEVWNEPNLKNPLPHILGEFWTGTQDEYFKLFEYTSKALKRVSPRLRVGGPTTSGTPAWIEPFLTYCREKSVPVDFVSSHAYPSQTEPNAFYEAVVESVSMAKAHSMPFFLSEYNDGLGFGCCHDRSYAAAFLAHHALLWQNESLIDHSYFAGISYWTFSDIFEELYMDRDPFHNGYGLLTVDLIPKPAFRMFEMLAKFPGVFFRNVAGSTWENVTSFSGIKNETESFVHIQTICTQFVPGSSSMLRQTRTNISVEYDYNIDHSSGKSAISSTIRCELSVAAIDSQHTNPFETWKAMHSPSPLNPRSKETLLNASRLDWESVKCMPTLKNGTLHVQAYVSMEMNGVVIVDAKLFF